MPVVQTLSGVVTAVRALSGRCLRMNNQSAVGSNDAFYNIGTGGFTYVARFMYLRQAPSGGQDTHFTKVGAPIPANGATVGTGYAFYVTNNQANTFLMRESTSPSDRNRYFISGYIPLAQFANVLWKRTSTTAEEATNPGNYLTTINGQQQGINTGTTGAFGNANIDNDAAIGVGPSFVGYISLTAFYTRAWSAAEIANFQNAGLLPIKGARVLYNYDAVTGTTLADKSSVRKNATLIGFAPEDTTSGAVWLWEDGVLAFYPNEQNGVRVFTAPTTITVFTLMQFNGISSAAYSFDGGATYQPAALGDPVNFTMTKGQQLSIKASNSNDSQYATVEIHYNKL